MKKEEKKIREKVEKEIEGLIISFIDEYCELHKINRTIEACHQYVKSRAEEEKKAFIEILNSNYDEKAAQSFKTIENTWLVFIETLDGFKRFLVERKKYKN